MNSIKITSRTQLAVPPIFNFFKNSLIKNTPSSGRLLSLTALGFSVFLCCSVSQAADKSGSVVPASAATVTTSSPLHQDARQPQTLTLPVSPDKDASASVPAEATNGAVPEPDNKIVIVSRPQVTGLWAMTIPGAQCIEYYNFMEKGDVVIKSGAEWTYGKYVYQVPDVAEPGSPVLAMRIQYDNLKTDCSGNAIDQRGEDQQQYVKWTGASSMEFCTTQDGAQCFASLRRVLP